MKRREFTKVIGAAVAGLGAGLAATARLSAGDESEGGARHACKGMNECKGQGGCKSGDNGCAGKNSCKGKGGCAVPVKKKDA